MISLYGFYFINGGPISLDGRPLPKADRDLIILSRDWYTFWDCLAILGKLMLVLTWP